MARRARWLMQRDEQVLEAIATLMAVGGSVALCILVFAIG